MTQGACRILIYLGTLRHLWRSIKSLRKLSRDDANNGNDSISPSVHLDILEVWSLLGLHSLYISTGLEQFFQYLPLYFYVKMFGLFLFFFFPYIEKSCSGLMCKTNPIEILAVTLTFTENKLMSIIQVELIFMLALALVSTHIGANIFSGWVIL